MFSDTLLQCCFYLDSKSGLEHPLTMTSAPWWRMSDNFGCSGVTNYYIFGHEKQVKIS